MIYLPNIAQCLSCFKDCCSNSCDYIVSYENTVSTLAAEASQLKNKSEDVRREVEAARRQGLMPKNEVLGWLNSVADLEDEARKISARFGRMSKCFCGFPVNVCPSFLLRRRAEAALVAAAELKQREFLKVADGLDLVRVCMIHRPETFGMDEAFEELRRHARDDEVSVIGIRGMGGVGKTALLRRFNNDFADNGMDADVVIFLQLPVEHEVQQIQRALFSRLNLAWQDAAAQRERADDIFRVLSNVKFVLLLDNLWEPLNYPEVGIPIPRPQSKCKIVFTTRLEDVCSRMGAEKIVKVDCVAEAAAWSLFTLNAKIDHDFINANAAITSKAKLLVKKCGGLPAALITVGQAMASKKIVQEWHHAVNILKDAPHQLPGMEEGVLNPLKLSYDRLPDGKLRSCASSFTLMGEGCAFSFTLMGEGCAFSHYYLRKMWIGEVIIDDFDHTWDAENKAHYLLGILAAASLIEKTVGDDFKMHPMVRAMNLWVARECGNRESKWLSHDRDGLAESPGAEKWRAAERIALPGNTFSALPEAPDCPDLVYLDLGFNNHLTRIPSGFFSRMPSLRILELQDLPIEDLPASICSLVLLQFLGLSGTKIKSLPRELGALVNLRYFSFSSARCLRRIPDQVMSRLQELRWLKMSDSYSGWAAEPSDEGEAHLEELEILTKLKVLGVTIGTAASLRRVFGSQRIAASLHWLHVHGCEGLTSLNIPSPELPVEAMPNIIELRLHRVVELEEVAFASAVLSNLQDLQLSCLPRARLKCKCTYIYNLRSLTIEDCDEIDRLVELQVEKNDDLEKVAKFPKLKKIKLRRLPEFGSLSDGDQMLAFPALETIEVKDCPKLKKLRLSGAENLKVIKGERSWWEELVWDAEVTESSFMNLFKEL